MRILGIGLLTVLLFALLRFAYLQPELEMQSFLGLGDADGRVQHNLVSNLPDISCAKPANPNQHTFLVHERDTWTALSGSPGYASASFNMPKEVSVVDGTLFLDLRAELQDDSVARLRLNINGERRGEILLQEGISTSTIQVNLLPSDLTQSQLLVSLSASGTFPQIACVREWTGGMIVHIEPTSRVELTTEGPLLDLGDRLRATGSPYKVIWPSEATVNDHERLIGFGINQRLQDIRTDFVPAGQASCPAGVALSPEDLWAVQRIVESASGSGDMEARTWPLEIALDGPNAAARFFEYETVWRHTYDLHDTPHAEYPTALALGLTAVGLKPEAAWLLPHAEYPTAVTLEFNAVGLHAEAQWLLTVTLNNTTIFAERLSGETLNFDHVIELPYDLHAFSNTLEIRLVSGERKVTCINGSPITAQLKRSTVLHGGVAAPDVAIGQFINAFSGQLQLDVSDKLNATEASSAVIFLTETFGDRVRWILDQPINYDEGYVIVANRSELLERFAQMREEWTDHLFWLVVPTPPMKGKLPFRQIPLTDASLLEFKFSEGPRIAAIAAVRKSDVPSRAVAETSQKAESTETQVQDGPAPALAPSTDLE